MRSVFMQHSSFPSFSRMASSDKCCSSHHFTNHVECGDDIDPCLAKEISRSERERIQYIRFKEQSDQLLRNLNIRTSRYRIRGSVAPDDRSDSGEETECTGDNCNHKLGIVSVNPNEFVKFAARYKNRKMFLMCVPCDYDMISNDEALKELESELRNAEKGSRCQHDSVLFCKFQTTVCVCGKCDQIERKLTGPLRSICMLLRSNPSVLLLRNAGLLGLWSKTDGPVISFISKHSA
jgi:hypothetical protein